MQRKYIILLVSMFLFVAGVGVSLYFILIHPQQDKLASLQEKVTTEKKILESLKLEQKDIEKIDSSREIQRKLPVQKVPDQVLLTLEKAEGLSDTFIDSIDIAESEIEQNIEDSKPEQVSLFPPEGVQGITFDLGIYMENFSDLMRFVEEIESSNRLISIDALTFDDQYIEEGEKGFLYSFLTATAYFYPSLTELASEEPQYHYREKPNKVNPFSDLNRTGDNNSPGRVAEDVLSETPSASEDWSEHVVQEGENFYKIVYHHYGEYNDNLAQLVRNANDRTDEKVYVGETLLLPENG